MKFSPSFCLVMFSRDMPCTVIVEVRPKRPVAARVEVTMTCHIGQFDLCAVAYLYCVWSWVLTQFTRSLTDILHGDVLVAGLVKKLSVASESDAWFRSDPCFHPNAFGVYTARKQSVSCVIHIKSVKRRHHSLVHILTRFGSILNSILLTHCIGNLQWSDR